jgi:predicted outer membrane lipoprotein
LVCGTLNLAGAFGIFTDLWNRAINAHAQDWEALAPWDRQVDGDFEMVYRMWGYEAVTQAVALAVMYTSDGTVIVTVEAIDY